MRHSIGRLTVALAITSLLAACGDEAGDGTFVGAITADGAKAGPRGPLGHIKAALATVGLRAEQQQTVDGLVADLKTKAGPMRRVRGELMAEVARQLRAGTLDQARLEAQLGKMRTAALGMKPAVAAALNKLHATLDPAQREQLVTALQDRKGKRGFRKGHHRHMKQVFDQLGLSEEQRQKIREAVHAGKGECDGKGPGAGKGRGERGMHHRGEHHARMKAMAEAFRSPTFDATKLDLLGGKEKRLERHAGHMLQVARVVLPLLSADQRNKLASLIEVRAKLMDAGW